MRSPVSVGSPWARPRRTEDWVASRQESCLVSEELGRSLAPFPFASTATAIDALSRFGSEAQQAAWLPRLVVGVCVGAVDLEHT